MASKQFERAKPHAGSNPGPKVRVVARVRGFSEWISVNKPQGENSEGVTISFGEQSSSRYVVDYCYEEHEENEMIYLREVKPLISAVFEGHNSTVIAYGARGSGKTHLIQGSDEIAGLAVLSIAEFLSVAEKNGKSIAISLYEVDHQEHAVDLLNPEQTPIMVFEDRGRIQFKGLTQILVKSIAEFQNLYFTACSAQKAAPKKGYEHARRSHMGLIVHVFSQNETTETGLVSKMNFVDLAGYEDCRRKSSDGSCLAEINKINKSIYVLLNVCHALSTNDNRVPYRESKLTRMLQDTLRGTSKILMVACLNPSFCQDTIYMASLASRSCQGKHQTPLDSTKKSESSARKMVTSQKSHTPLDSIKKSESSARKLVTSQKSQTPLDSVKKSESSARKMVTSQKSQTPLDSTKKTESSVRKMVTSQKSQIPKSISTTAKKLTGSSSHIYEKKAVVAKSATKGRKLFDEGSHSAKVDKARSLSATGSTFETSMPEEEISIAPVTKASEPLLDNSLLEAGNPAKPNPRVEKDNSFPDASTDLKANLTVENDHSSLNASSELELYPRVEKGISGDREDHQEKHTPYASSNSEVQEGISKENNSLLENSITSELRDVTNRMKWLYWSIPLSVQIPEKESISFNDQISMDIVEPKTPVTEQSISLNDQISMDIVEPKTPVTEQSISLNDQISTDIVEPKTPVPEQNMRVNDRWDVMNARSPWETFSVRGSGMKNSLVQEYLRFLNTANKEELKKLKGIGEKRATFILELREESPEPFKSLDDLKDIGLSAKQIKGIMKKEVGELFN